MRLLIGMSLFLSFVIYKRYCWIIYICDKKSHGYFGKFLILIVYRRNIWFKKDAINIQKMWRTFAPQWRTWQVFLWISLRVTGAFWEVLMMWIYFPGKLRTWQVFFELIMLELQKMIKKKELKCNSFIDYKLS